MENQNQTPMTLDVDEVLSGTNEQTKRVAVVRDDDGKEAIGFVIVGKNSKRYRDRAAQLRAAGIRKQANKRTRIDTKTEEGSVAFSEMLEQNEVELAIAVVVDYFGLMQRGEPFPCTPENTRALFAKMPSWREQVSAELEAEDGFLKLSSANSAISRAANSALADEERTE